jgi:hypothetical protein
MRRTTLCAALALGLTACEEGAPPAAGTEAPTPAAPAPALDVDGSATPARPAADAAPPVEPPPGPDEDAAPPPPPDDVPVEVGDPVEGALRPPRAPVEPPARARKRMNIDQLAAAVRAVSGGIGWIEARGGVEVDLFDELSATLGKPDYAQVTRENLQPSALFQKLFDDAARSVCAAWITRDLEAPVEPRLLPADDADPDAHLRGLVRRFHQRTVPPGGPDEARWRWLLDSVVFVTGDPVAGWNAVCVGLFTHPDFYSY